MPYCDETLNLQAFFDGRLETTAHLRYAKHLRDCQHCRAAATALGKLLPSNPLPLEVHPLSTSDISTISTLDMEVHIDQIGPYTLRRLLGRGGMGTVYEARHRELDRLVALKVLSRSLASHEDAVIRFQREMKALGKLNHPNVVRATDAGEANGVRYLAMDLVDGLDLLYVLRTCGPLDVAEVAEIAKQAAHGLSHAHARNIIHRDLKPSNLMVASPGTVQLLDLGLAVVMSATGREEDQQLGSTIVGTHDYMAPEQWGEASTVTAKVDVYGLGCVLYHALADQPMFANKSYRSPQDKMRGHLYDSPPPLPGNVPVSVADFITLRMLAKDPIQRPTADEVAAQFAVWYPTTTPLMHLIERTRLAPGTGFSDGKPTLTLPKMLQSASILKPPIRPITNWKVPLIVALVILLFIAGLVWLMIKVSS